MKHDYTPAEADRSPVQSFQMSSQGQILALDMIGSVAIYFVDRRVNKITIVLQTVSINMFCFRKR